MKYTFRPRGVCSQEISFDLEGETVRNISFYGGCHGNLQAISKLLDGMTVSYAKEKLSGIRCGYKSTSCGDQLVRGLEAALEMAEKKNKAKTT